MRRDFQRFPEISEISERFRGISRQVYEISVSDGPLGVCTNHGQFYGTKHAARPRTRSHSCSVCLEVFTDPKVLPCCHTFCLKCLEKTARTAQTRGEITCPLCRNTHLIPAGEFFTDFMEVYEIEAAGLKSESAGSVVCGECEEYSGPPRSYRTNCRNYLLHKRV